MSAPGDKSDDDVPTGEHKPVTAFDVSDENGAMLANHMRALQREMRSGFELVSNRLLTSIERITDKLDDLSDKFDEERARRSLYEAKTDAEIAAIKLRLRRVEKPRAKAPKSPKRKK